MPRLLPLFALVLSLLWAAGLAQAHAVLQSADPADGSVLEAAPARATLGFNEPVAPLAIRLIAPDGSETDLTAAVPGGQVLSLPLPPLGQGTHLISWRVASDDGHPVAGAMVFSVGAESGVAPVTGGNRAVQAAVWAARWAMTAGLVLGIGGAVFAALTGVPAQRPVAAALQTGLLAAPLYLGLHGLDALGLSLRDLLTGAPWAAGWGTSFGPSVALAMLAAGLALLALGLPRGALAASLAALALLGIAYAISGHAGAAAPRALTRGLVFAHLAAVVLWIGALAPLALSLRGGTAPLARFSAAIPYPVAVLALSGAGLTAVQLGADPAQWPSAYGAILAGKLALLGLILALAVQNRRLTAPVLSGDAPARGRLRRGIHAELVLAVLLLALTAGWRFTPPPRALAMAAPAAAPAYAHLHSDTLMADLTLTPGRAGPVTAELFITDGTGQPVDPFAVTLALSLPDRGIERISRTATATPGTPGLWRVEGLVLPVPGRWSLTLDLRRTRFTLVKLGAEIVIN